MGGLFYQNICKHPLIRMAGFRDVKHEATQRNAQSHLTLIAAAEGHELILKYASRPA